MVAAIAGFAATLGRLNNPDTLWHLAIGRWILANHAVPDISRFYYSATAGVGYDYSWLSQAILFGSYQLLGGAGPAILTAVVAGFTFYLLYKLLERNGSNLLVNLAVLCLALVAVTAYLSGRPALFTVAFFTAELYILSGWVASRGQGRGVQFRGWLIWLIPPMVAVWANLHPGFFVAPLLILLFLPLSRNFRDRWVLAACLAATIAGMVFNPSGWRLYSMPLDMVRAIPLLRGLSEWHGVSGWEAVVWGGFVALVTCGISLRRQPTPIVLLAAGAALAAGVSCRNMPLFGMVAVFVLGRTLLPIITPSLERFSFVRKFSVDFAGSGGWFWMIAVPLGLAAAVRLGASPMNLEFDFSAYPEAAVRYIENNDCPDRLFVREIWSGYVLWAMPDRQLFYDAKGGFSREAAEGHSELVKPKEGWRGVAYRYGLQTLLLERGSPLAVILGETSDWRREYSDSLSEVFVRVPAAPELAPAMSSGSGLSPAVPER